MTKETIRAPDFNELLQDARLRWDPEVISHRSIAWRFGTMELVTRAIRKKTDATFEPKNHYIIANPARKECRFDSGPIKKSMPLCFLPAYTNCWGWVDVRPRHEYSMLSINPSFVSQVSDGHVDLNRLQFLAQVDMRSSCIERALRRLKQEVLQPDGNLLAESVMAEVVLCLLDTSSNVSLRRTVPGGLTRTAMHRVREFIEENLDKDIGLMELAGVAALSPTHFIRAFRRTTGIPPVAFLADCRVRRACQFLRSGVLPLAEVARRCGYSSQSYFSSRFAQAIGVPPGVYRAAMKPDKAKIRFSDGESADSSEER